MTFKKCNLLIVMILTSLVLYAQNPEAELKSKAEKAFKKENFVEASKLYSQLLTFNMVDPMYNYRYGISLIYNSRKKADAIKHLTFASKTEGFDPEVFYYLGKAYHLDYNFAEAIKNYNLYKSKSGGKLNKELEVDNHIKMSENGKRLLSTFNEIVVLDKKEIEIPSFFRIYELNDIGGNMIVTAQFQSKIDKKREHVPLIHFPSNPKRIFYSSYGEDENTGKDIYMRQRLPDGTWSLPQKVPGKVNTEFDEDYPYIHPKGDYLYFSSKGHNSMGGYDIFRSRYNEESNEFEAPENIDFPISSPDNDLFYIVDSLDENAYFSSARQSLDGKMHVYKVKVDKVPLQLAVVKASFQSLINPANKKISLDIYDYAINKKIGTFKSNVKGNVLITFPKGGKYEYIVKVDGKEREYRHVVSIPFLKEFKPLKQKILHENKDGDEVVTIIDLFNEEIDESYEVLAEIAKMRSELNPNMDQFDIAAIAEKANNKEVYSKLGMNKLNDIEVIQKLEELVDIQEKKVEELEKLKEKSIGQAIESVGSINDLQKELKLTVANANTKSGSERRELFEEAGKIVNELNYLDDYIDMLLQTADSLSPIIKGKELDIAKYNKIVAELRKIYQSGDLKEFGKRLNEDLNQLLALQKENPEFVTASLNNQILAKHAEMTEIEAKISAMNTTLDNAKKELQVLEKQLETAKSKEKIDIQRKIDEKKLELELLPNSIKLQNTKLIDVNDKLLKLEASLAYFQEILNSTIAPSKSSTKEVADAFKSSDDQNTKVLKTYVEQQLKELGIEMQTLKSKSEIKNANKPNSSYARNIASTNQTTNKTVENNGSNNENNGIIIKSQTNKSTDSNKNSTENKSTIINETTTKVAEKNYIAENNSNIKNETISNLGDTNKTIEANNSTPILKNETKSNENKTVINNSNEVSNKQVLEKENVSSKPKNNDPINNSVKSKLSKDYNDNKKAINENSSLSDEQKQLAILRQEKLMKFIVSKELDILENKAKNNPGNTQFDKDIEELKAFKEQLSSEITKLETEIKTKYPEAGNNKLTETQITQVLSPNYEKTITRIDINKGISDISKAKLSLKEDEKLILLAKKDRARLNEELSKDAGNINLKAEIKSLDGVIKSAQDRIDKNNMLISTYKVNQTLNNLGSGLLDEEIIIDAQRENVLINTVKNEVLKGNTAILEQDLTNTSELEKQSNTITNYYNALADRQYELEKQLNANPGQMKILEELAIVNKEIEKVRKKLDEIDYKIDDADEKAIAENYIVLNNEVSYLKQELNELNILINDRSTNKKEIPQLKAQLLENQEKQAETYEKINKLQETLIKKYPPNKIKNKRQAKITQNVLDSLLYDRFLANDKLIKSELDNLKASKGGSKKSKILPTLLEKQEENSIIAQQLLYNAQMKKHLRQVIQYSDNMYTLQSTNTLNKSKYNLKYSKEGADDNLSQEKIKLTKAKKKKKPEIISNIESLKKEIESLEQLQRNLDVEFAKREDYSKDFANSDRNPIEVSDQDRELIKQSNVYESTKDLYVQRKMTFEAMKLLYENLEKAKDNYNKAILDFSNDPIKSNKQFAARMFEALKSIYKQYYELQNKYESMTAAYKKATANISSLAKYEQLFEEAYESEVALITARAIEKRNQMEAEGGFNFSTTEKSGINNANLATLDEEKINFANEIPENGTFVQIHIGDLDQPLMSNVFNKFDKINAELLANGKTAYYSDNLTSYDQLEGAVYYLKNLGYNNAKINAYKDGQAVSFQDLKKEYEIEKIKENALAQTSTDKSGKSKNNNVKSSVSKVNSSKSETNNIALIDKTSENKNANNSQNAPNKLNSESKTNNESNISTNDLKSNEINKINNSNEIKTTKEEKTLTESNIITNSSKVDNETIKQNEVNNNNTLENSNLASNTPKENKSNNNSVKSSSFENFKNAQSIENKKGLFFTVQVGAFNNKKFPSSLKNINPVYSKTFSDGTIRYSTGIFHSVNEALSTKQNVVNLGVFDAFITAYYNGQRITIVEAERILQEKGESILESK
jgi:hypothetical protein